eukprot:jgi/Tetstr1/453704/TSEL_040660.t1
MSAFATVSAQAAPTAGRTSGFSSRRNVAGRHAPLRAPLRLPMKAAPAASRRGVRHSMVCTAAGEVEKLTKATRNPSFPFTKIVGQEEMKLALLLNVIDRNIGGVLIMGDRGTAKSVCVRSLVELLPEMDAVPDDPFNSSPTDPSLMGPECLEAYKAGETLPSIKKQVPLVELPLGATEDRICGTIDIEKALMEGKKAYEPGLLAAANRGILYIDEVNLLDDGLVDVVLDSAAGGINTVEREGVSLVHPAKFIMVGSGNPEEGEMRPQLLDRFGLKVGVSTLFDIEKRTELVLNRIAYDKNPIKYNEECKEEQEALRAKLEAARKLLPEVTTTYEIKLMISEICSRCNVDGLRGDLVTNRAAAAYVALQGRKEVTVEDVGAVIGFTLAHRMRKDVMDGMANDGKVKAVFRRVTDPEVREREEAAEKMREEAKAKAAEDAKSGDKRAGKKAASSARGGRERHGASGVGDSRRPTGGVSAGGVGGAGRGGIASKISKHAGQPPAGQTRTVLAPGRGAPSGGEETRGVMRPTYSSAKKEAAGRGKQQKVAAHSGKQRPVAVDEERAMKEVSAFLSKRRAELAAREGEGEGSGLASLQPVPISRAAGADAENASPKSTVAPQAAEAEHHQQVTLNRGQQVASSARASLRDSLSALATAPALGRSGDLSVRASLEAAIVARETARSASSTAEEAGDMDEFEDFTREVAACIIQHYWREALTARREAASLPPANKGQHEDGGAKTTKCETASATQTAQCPAIKAEAMAAAAVEPEQTAPNLTEAAQAPLRRSGKLEPRKHGSALSASLKGEDIVRLGSLMTTGGMSDLVVVVEQEPAQDEAAEAPMLRSSKIAARSDTEKELLSWAEGLLGRKSVCERDSEPVHIQAMRESGEGALADAVKAGGHSRQSDEMVALAVPEKRAAEELSPERTPRNAATPVEQTAEEEEEEEEEGEPGTPTPRKIAMEAITPYSPVPHQAPPPPPVAKPASPVAARSVPGEPDAMETTPVRASVEPRSLPVATVRQSAQKLAEIMSFLDQIEEGDAAGGGGGREEPERGWRLGAIAEAEEASRTATVVARPGKAGGADEPAQLAASVFDGIKRKMAALQQQMEEAAGRGEQLELQLEETRAQAAQWVEQAEARAASQLERQQQDSKRTIARHLEFIDRLLADKDSLAAKCTSLANEVQGMESRHEAAMAALKDGWAAELRRQKEAWAAAEKIKRESWAEEKTREVKELTIKGLEPEIQRLMAKHKVDLRKTEQKLGEEAQARLDAVARQHEDYVRQLRDRLLKEREDAVEKERIAAADRLRDVNERNEMQVQQLRQRLNNDADARVEEVERLRRADRQRLEAALEKAREEAMQHEGAAGAAAEKQRKELMQAHEKALAAAREEWDAQQAGWRAAVAERASREVAECEKRLRTELMEERNEQIESVIDRLEEEASAAKATMEEEFAQREAALVEKHRGALAELRSDEERTAEKNRALVWSQAEAERRLEDSQNHLRELQRELKAKNGTIAWMESQVTEAQGGWEQRTRELASLNAKAEEVHRAALASKDRELQQLRAELAGLRDRLDGIHAKNAAEMDHVEARVKAAIGKKDEQITKLRRELDASVRELRQTQAVLEAQQQVFCS